MPALISKEPVIIAHGREGVIERACCEEVNKGTKIRLV
jgi:hypothetical protein